MINNDNNLLLIILIGIIMFWIFNINSSENFKNNNSINFSNGNFDKNNLEHYKDDKDKNVESTRTQSPLLNDQQLINKLYDKTNNSQQLLQTPPNNRDISQTIKLSQDIAKQFKETSSNNKPIGNLSDKQNTMGSLDQGYMLLPQNFMPDKKFEKVMPQKTKPTLTSAQLLPRDENKDWFQVPNSKFNLMQAVDLEIPEIKIGVDTVGQSRKNATYDLRTAPACPKFVVSPWSNSTIEPDYNTKPLC